MANLTVGKLPHSETPESNLDGNFSLLNNKHDTSAVTVSIFELAVGTLKIKTTVYGSFLFYDSRY